MKKDIHPEMKDCTVTCACGETFTCKSTKSEINVDDNVITEDAFEKIDEEPDLPELPSFSNV